LRLQRFLAQAGFGARRKCEQFILDGRVTVNGRGAHLGQSADPGDVICVDGQQIDAPEDKVYLALHKPVGYASDTSDPDAPTMFTLIDPAVVPQRLFGVGRLDKDSSGLILLTNDGDFAFRLTHPKFEHEKEYRVRVQGQPSEATLSTWRAGVTLVGETTKTAPARVTIVGAHDPHSLADPRSANRAGMADTTVLAIIMHEGRKRQIRRIAHYLGHPVVDLIRVRVGSVVLGTLQSGQWRRLTTHELQALNRPPASSPSSRSPRRSSV